MYLITQEQIDSIKNQPSEAKAKKRYDEIMAPVKEHYHIVPGEEISRATWNAYKKVREPALSALWYWKRN